MPDSNKRFDGRASVRTLKPQKTEHILIIAALLLFSAFVYYIRDSLSPLLIWLAIIFLLFPLRINLYVKHFLVFTISLFLIWFVSDTYHIITPFVISLTLAYLFDPLVVKLDKLKIKRSISVLTIELLVIGLFVLLAIVLVPLIIDQLTNLIKLSLTLSDTVTNWFEK